MKYIISESRLDKVIDAYLASRLEPHEIVEFKIPGLEIKKKFWVVDDIVVGEFQEEKFWIHINIFVGLKKYFELSTGAAVNQVRKYFFEHYNLEFYFIGDWNFTKNGQHLYDKYGKK